MTLQHHAPGSVQPDDDQPDDQPAFFAPPAEDSFGATFRYVWAGVSPIASQTLYLRQAGDAASISVDDLHQGQIGDCFLIASVGELALDRPAAIASMIRVNANGTETVTLNVDRNGRLPTPWTTSFKQVAVTVTNVFPSYSVNNAASQDSVGSRKEIWPQVLEKAVATLEGGYGAIADGGNPTTVMEELTGHLATFQSAAGVTLAQLQGWMAAGDLIVFDTSAQGSRDYNLVGGHAYMFEKLTTAGGAPAIQLGNPWGFDQPAVVPLSQLGRAFVEADVGRVA